ncbi:hypothetical protein OSB04_027556 [Centaurea solstitialis]|uniref:Integrase catalytic domain-containing protein n=1 Tax=Centaurea solstitialis TaxID=347529 RepID=A0AA38SE37_9ASTR|nr:hypothetical protein OSB04_027556 [Centaurea solstitialis]
MDYIHGHQGLKLQGPYPTPSATSCFLLPYLAPPLMEELKAKPFNGCGCEFILKLCRQHLGVVHFRYHTTNTILKSKKYFSKLKLTNGTVGTISGPVDVIEGIGMAHFLLPNGTNFLINNALFSPKSNRNLLSFNDIYLNGFHIRTITLGDKKYMFIVDKDHVLEKLPILPNGLHYTYINVVETNMVVKEKYFDPTVFSLWHDRLGHPGSTMMRRIIGSTNGHPLKEQKIPQTGTFTQCTSCSLGKLIVRPSPSKIEKELPTFLERIQGDICGPIHPPCGPFRYFMVLIDASSRWSHVCLLSTRNVAFARFLAQIIKLRAHFPDYSIKKVRLDNSGELTSQAFNDYWMSVGIVVEHSVAHVHTQNGLAESLIKRLQLIARPLIMRTKLPVSIWGHAILQAASLIRIRPSAYHTYTPLQLAFGQEPNISHLRIFECAVYVPIAPPQRTKMGPQRRLGIYVGYETSSIIRYLEPLTGDVFIARFAYCHFNETMFPALGGEKKIKENDVSWCEPSLSYLDPRTKQYEMEVQKIMHLVTKSYIPVVNAPAQVDVPVGQTNDKVTEESKTRLKRIEIATGEEKSVPEETQNIKLPADEDMNDINKEVAINYGYMENVWNKNKMRNIDDIFSYVVTCDVFGNDDPEPTSVIECQNRQDWVKWKDAIQVELDSLNKRKVFGPIVLTPEAVTPVGNRWVFVRKRNEKNEIMRYKARLVAQGFSQRPGIDYEETYSPVMDAITFRYLISLAVSKNLEMRLMNVVTAYLYGSLDSDIYMKIHEGFKMPEALSTKPREMYSIKLQRSLYGLKQSGRMWYNHLSDYLIIKGYTNNLICPCIFIKKTTSGYVIIDVYVDDLNIIGTHKEINETLEKPNIVLVYKIEHMHNGILVHQSNYVEKVLKRFNMDKSNPLSTPMVVRSLNVDNDPFRPCEENEEVLGPEVPYLSAIGAFMYLTNCTRPDISFAVNLLSNNAKEGFLGYADAGYLSDPHKARSQTGYILVATSSNHAEVIALHEASRECVWLRSMTQLIVTSCGLEEDKDPTLIYEDNAACVTQMKEGYIKSDKTKHIPPRFFSYTQDLMKSNQVEIKYVQSSNNTTNLFTKSLPTAIFRKHVHSIGIRHAHKM